MYNTFLTLNSRGVCVQGYFLNISIPEILKRKILCNESLNILPENYYFEILVLKYLKIPGTQTPLITITWNLFFLHLIKMTGCRNSRYTYYYSQK